MTQHNIRGCDAKIRPFPNPTELVCDRAAEPHDDHRAVLRDYAHPGSETVINWQESDRRTYRGEWSPCPFSSVARPSGCILPVNHRGRHEQ